MFIYRFRQLIRSRLLWGFFVIIIAFAFVAAGSCYKTPEGSIVGKINGKKITRDAYNQVSGAVLRMSGRGMDSNLPVRELERRTWEHLAAMQIAAENGLTAQESEVRDEILGDRMFQGPNGFDVGRYRLILRDARLTEALYERLIAQQVLMTKVGALMESATWVSPMELDDEIAAMTDVFTVQTMTFSNRFVNTDMPVSDEEHKAFYETNQESFRFPDRVSVRYITIPLSNYLARVTVPEDTLLDFYDANMNRFQTTDTNNVVSVKPFEDVRDEIFAEIQLEEARDYAETNLMFALFGRRTGATAEITLEAIAEQEEVEIKTSPLFSQSEFLFWTSDSRAFANAAFDLEPDSVDTRFGVVGGLNEISVIELLQESPAHIPPFEEVVEDVKVRKQEQARADAFDSYIKEVRTDITKLMEDGKTFEESARETAQNVSTSLTYTVSEMQMRPFENSYSIAYGAMTLKKGDLSEAIPLPSDQAMLIYVLDREQGSALNAEMMRAQIRSGMMRRRGGTLFGDWLKWNLGQQRFEPASAYAFSDVEEDEDIDAETL